MDDLPFSGAEHLDYIAASRRVARVLGLKPGEQAIVMNGRVSGFPFPVLTMP